jgi:hypothetical protein
MKRFQKLNSSLNTKCLNYIKKELEEKNKTYFGINKIIPIPYNSTRVITEVHQKYVLSQDGYQFDYNGFSTEDLCLICDNLIK